MGHKCFVPGCNTGYESQKKQGGPKLALFFPPKDANVLEKWKRAIPRCPKNRELTYKSKVCELHFGEHLINTTHKIQNKLDGSILLDEERGHKSLKIGAIPHIFPNLPHYLTKKQNPRKSPKKRYGTGSRNITRGQIVQHSREKISEILTCSSASQGQELKPILNLEDIMKNPKDFDLPGNKWRVLKEDKKVLFLHTPTPDIFKIDRYVAFSLEPLNKKPEIFLEGKEVSMDVDLVNNSLDLKQLLKKVSLVNVCPGAGIEKQRHLRCPMILPFLKLTVRCKFCNSIRRSWQKKQKRTEKEKVCRRKKIKAQREKIKRMNKQISSLKMEIADCKKRMQNMEEEAVQKILDSITEEKHREVVKACIMASKFKNPKNRRYTNEWMYECILMRIKASDLYRKMLRDKTLPLPSLRTIQRYIQKLHPQFGFHEPTFSLLSQKSKHMALNERHGTLMIDEMALQEGVAFDKVTMQVHGFVDLGSATPPNSDATLGDHALTFIFQPFRGQWFQAIGAFCSRGAAKGPELEKLTSEAIILLENAGFYVDAVVTDGGAWNRNMWGLFGVNAGNVSCINPASTGQEDGEKRRLWFLSDFPHLIKSIWSRVRNAKKLQTPDGEVKLAHWEALVENDDILVRHINICNKLSRDHIYPSNYQTMNVKMAFQFFSEDVALAMEHYRDKEEVPELQDCHSTVQFIRRVNRLIKAMNAKDPWDSLQAEDENASRKTIIDFLDFLRKWKEEVKNADLRLAYQTDTGLSVSLKGTLELCDYVTEKLGFQFLKTRRLNQDPLEHFFGRVREACGSNTHPDPQQFVQVFRLLSTASLIKPPRGSNVSGGEMLKSLLSLPDLMSESNAERKVKLEQQLDRVLDSGDEQGIMEKNFASLTEENYLEMIEEPQQDHSYHQNNIISGHAMQMFCGYVARKVRNFSTAKQCQECFNSLTLPPDAKRVETQYLIEMRSRGFLLTPSISLYNFLFKVEHTILRILSQTKLNKHILFQVVEELQSSGIYSAVGCKAHCHDLTKATLTFYLNTRMIFACKRFMKRQSDIAKKKRKAKSLLKQFKLNAIPATDIQEKKQHEKQHHPHRDRSNNTPTQEQEQVITASYQASPTPPESSIKLPTKRKATPSSDKAASAPKRRDTVPVTKVKKLVKKEIQELPTNQATAMTSRVSGRKRKAPKIDSYEYY